jgi:hypothetical protein
MRSNVHIPANRSPPAREGSIRALAAYHQVLSADRDPAALLVILLHEHHVRALGLEPRFEKVTRRLARAAAMRRLALAGAL